MKKLKIIKGSKGKKPIKFHEGGLHASAGVSSGKKIPLAKHHAAAAGAYGPLAKKQELFYENVLKKKRRAG